MTYYHVSQGVHSLEPMLAIEAADPVGAARKYFHFLAIENSWPVACAEDGVVRMSGEMSFSKWEDILFNGCFVENRDTGDGWSVSIDEPPTRSKDRMRATLMIREAADAIIDKRK